MPEQQKTMEEVIQEFLLICHKYLFGGLHENK